MSDAEVEREYKRRNEKVKLQVVALTADKFRDKVTVTDADVAAYFDAHKAEYRIGETAQDPVPAARSRPGARSRSRCRQQDIERYYNENIQQYRRPSRCAPATSC